MPPRDRRLRVNPPEILPPISHDREQRVERDEESFLPPNVIVVQQPGARYQSHQPLGAGGWFARAFAATSGYLLAVLIFSLGSVAITMFLCCGGLGLFTQAAVENARETTRRIEAENDRKEAELRRLIAQDESPEDSSPESKDLNRSESDDGDAAPALILPDGDLPAPPPAEEPKKAKVYPWRIWKSADGMFSTEAQLVSRGGSDIKLRKRNGVIVVVKYENLSQQDQEWLALPVHKRQVEE